MTKLGYRRGQKYIKNLRLYEVRKAGRSYWRLRIPDPSGKGFTERQFSNESEAVGAFELAYVAHMNHGVKAGSLGSRERGDALGALDILQPLGTTLAEAARFYAQHHVNIQQSKSVADVVNELLRAKAQDGLSLSYLKDLRIRLGRFTATFGMHKISEISVTDIDDWLRGLNVGALSRNTYWLRLNVLFEFANGRRWCTVNPLAQVSKAKWKGTEPGILSPDQFARLLENADAKTLPYWAIGGFCGLRSAELARLEWQDIDFDAGLVEVTPAKSKTAARRHVPIREALRAWLAPYRAMNGKICPGNLRTRLEADRRRAGITNWPSNALRHSFASYHLERFQQPGQLTVEMGHTSEGLVARFYRQRVRPEAARAWWNIRPATTSPAITALAS